MEASATVTGVGTSPSLPVALFPRSCENTVFFLDYVTRKKASHPLPLEGDLYSPPPLGSTSS